MTYTECPKLVIAHIHVVCFYNELHIGYTEFWALSIDTDAYRLLQPVPARIISQNSLRAEDAVLILYLWLLHTSLLCSTPIQQLHSSWSIMHKQLRVYLTLGALELTPGQETKGKVCSATPAMILFFILHAFSVHVPHFCCAFAPKIPAVPLVLSITCCFSALHPATIVMGESCGQDDDEAAACPATFQWSRHYSPCTSQLAGAHSAKVKKSAISEDAQKRSNADSCRIR